jgi:hypothetical protein
MESTKLILDVRTTAAACSVSHTTFRKHITRGLVKPDFESPAGAIYFDTASLPAIREALALNRWRNETRRVRNLVRFAAAACGDSEEEHDHTIFA